MLKFIKFDYIKTSHLAVYQTLQASVITPVF